MIKIKVKFSKNSKEYEEAVEQAEHLGLQIPKPEVEEDWICLREEFIIGFNESEDSRYWAIRTADGDIWNARKDTISEERLIEILS